MTCKHIQSAADLITTHEETRAGFLRLALAKNQQATPYVEEAKALRASVIGVQEPEDLFQVAEIRPALLTAAGLSDKALGHLTEVHQMEAIRNLVNNFLEPAGDLFVDELVYRFLLTRGDSLGGKMRNLAGKLAEQQLIRTLIATLSVRGTAFSWQDRNTGSWKIGKRDDTGTEANARGLSWSVGDNKRMLLLNRKVPIVGKNIDLCLFDGEPKQLKRGKASLLHQPEAYIALGELKGGIDPAGADEHWKTANSALNRIRDAFEEAGLKPETFFIGAAIENSMADEIYAQLLASRMSNAANATKEDQLNSICIWLVNL